MMRALLSFILLSFLIAVECFAQTSGGLPSNPRFQTVQVTTGLSRPALILRRSTTVANRAWAIQANSTGNILSFFACNTDIASYVTDCNSFMDVTRTSGTNTVSGIQLGATLNVLGSVQSAGVNLPNYGDVTADFTGTLENHGVPVQTQYVAVKTANTDRTSTTTPTADPDLQITLASSHFYRVHVHAVVCGVTTGTQGFSWSMDVSSVSLNTLTGIDPGFYQGIVNGSYAANSSGRFSTSYAQSVATIGVCNVGDEIDLKFSLDVNSSSGAISFRWSQASSSTNATRLGAGSYIIAERLN